MNTRIWAGATIVALLAWDGVAHAHHFNRGHFVTAYAPCLAQNANTTTSDGTAACSPPVPLSNCAVAPSTAIRLRPDAKNSFLMLVFGRRLTRIEGNIPTIKTRVLVRGVEDCSGEGYRGELDVRTVLRLHVEDPSCDTGHCTLPDFSYTQRLRCSGSTGKCRLRGDSMTAMAEQGLAPLPFGLAYSAEVLRFEILDRAARPLLTTGISSGDDLLPVIAGRSGPQRWLVRLRDVLSPPDAHAYGANGTGPSNYLLSRYVRSFAACPANATNTLTSDGQPACAAVAYSDCNVDPTNAVVPVVPPSGNYQSDTKGRGKVYVSFTGDDHMMVAGYIRTLEDCAEGPYSGPLFVDATFRTTLHDSGCAGGACTLVDGSLLRATIDIHEGSTMLSDPHPFSELLGVSGSTSLSSEVLNVRFLDRSGNAVLTGPSLLVRCNDPGGAIFCFGN